MSYAPNIATTIQNKTAAKICEEHESQEDQASGPSLAMPIIIWRNRIGVNHHRKRSDWLGPSRTPIAITESGEQQRSRLSGYARQSQQHTGKNSATRSGQHNGGDCLPLAGPQSHCSFAQGSRNRSQKFFRAADRNRDHHHPQSETAGKS